jgi:hypothetical protein
VDSHEDQERIQRIHREIRERIQWIHREIRRSGRSWLVGSQGDQEIREVWQPGFSGDPGGLPAWLLRGSGGPGWSLHREIGRSGRITRSGVTILAPIRSGLVAAARHVE